MPDREKVIESLNKAMTWVGYGDIDNVTLSELEETIESAIALLREQEPVKPKRKSRAMLPCKCGCKRREHWFAPDAEMPEELRCCQCRFTVCGKNQTDVIRQWNKAVSGNE